MKIPLIFVAQWTEIDARVAQARLRQSRREVDMNRLPAEHILTKYSLAEHQHGAPAAGANPLIVFCAALDLVAITECFLYADQIFSVLTRGERRAATPTKGGSFTLSDVFIEADAELRGPLKDVKELSEREPQQREDHGHRMQDREKIVRIAFHPGVACGQHQPGHAHREQKDERQEVFAKLLQSGRPVIAHSPSQGKHHPGDHKKRGPYQSVKHQETGD